MKRKILLAMVIMATTVLMTGKASAVVNYRSTDERISALENRIAVLEREKFMYGSCADISSRVSDLEKRVTDVESATKFVLSKVMESFYAILKINK